MSLEKRVVLAVGRSSVEPLAPMGLATIAEQEGWEMYVVLVDNFDFGPADELIRDKNPDLVCASAYTGSHTQFGNWLKAVKNLRPEVETVWGGPHPTCWPRDASKFADYTVVSEGFDSFRMILRGEAKHGILLPRRVGEFPMSLREAVYDISEEHARSNTKSFMSGTGCDERCGHCYNSVNVRHIQRELGPSQADALKFALGGCNGRLFPHFLRPVQDVLNEIEALMSSEYAPKKLFDQNDIHGSDLEWLRFFASEKIRRGLDIPYHALARFDRLDPETSEGRERFDLLQEAGCDGLTFAIESAIPEIRRFVLKRYMRGGEKDKAMSFEEEEALMFRVFEELAKRDFRVRTQQMIGLPYGATRNPTEVGLEADLKLVELNSKLLEASGLKHFVPWCSIYHPYLGTATGDYCRKHGFYLGETNDDLNPSFFDNSVLRFVNHWVGPDLKRDTPDVWKNEEELNQHILNLQVLRCKFYGWSKEKEGHNLARTLLGKGVTEEDIESFRKFDREERHHAYKVHLGL